MSLGNCIPGLVAEGKITKKQGEKAQAAYDRHYRRLLRDMGPVQAAAEASEAALGELEFEAKLKKRQALLQVAAQQRMMADMEKVGGGAGAALKVLAAGDGRNVMNVEHQANAIRSRAHSRIEGILSRHSRNLAGEARDKSGLRDIVRELFGESTGNLSAREYADAWRGASEMLRQRFNRAGGAIGKRADWGLPQSHDMMKVRAAGYDAWKAAVLPRLALDRMIDEQTGGPFTAETIEAALRDVFESIRSDGWNKREAGGQGQGKLANRRADHRFLIFKTADDWMAYQEAFGTGTPFDAMMGHIEGMSRDIALMEVMGPNPAASLRWLKDHVRKAAAVDADPTGGGIDAAKGAAKQLQELYDVVTGDINSPVSTKWARRLGGVRSFLTSAFLGSASLSAVSDVGFQAHTRRFNGLPVTGAITGYVKLLNPANAEDRKVAVRLGLIAEEASKMAASMNRYVDSIQGPEVAARLSDAVLRLSGLSIWTQAGRWAFGMEVLGHLADVRGQAFGDLDPSLRGMLDRYGIDGAAWDKIRATDTYKHKGAEFLRPDDVADEALGDAMIRMVLTETDYAVPSATARARATLSFGQRPGTLGGEIMRNAFLFKSFGVSMILTHGARAMAEQGLYNRAKYFAGLTITTTLLGALALQLKEVAKGKDAPGPFDEDGSTNWEFWGRAVLQGGGYGIFGDFIGAAANENAYGDSIASAVAGPVIGTAGDIAGMGGRLITDAIDPDKEVNFGKEGVKALKRYLPGGSLWYARAAYERIVLDQLAEWADPDYQDSWRRMEDRAADQGQEYYWRPGELAPDRLPRMAQAPE